ncbi:short-chain dehydrogenase, partial [Shigella boydii]|nr:short-chain dehydrogenase [Shigella boydii]
MSGNRIRVSVNRIDAKIGNDSNLLIVFYVQIMPDDLV